MLRPFLFVGVGGSGGKTLRALKQTLDRRLKQNDWHKGIPAAWQFIQVDTAYDGVGFPAPMLPLEDCIVMVGPGQTYDYMVRSLESRFPSTEERNQALAGWLAPHSAIPIAMGAGMVRNIGRAVSAAGLATLRDGLKEALDKLQAPSNASDLAELSKLLHPKSSSGKAQDPAVLIISSIAGGSGAGMFMDVAETLKSIDPSANWLQDQLAFLYAPEVFDSIAPNMRIQIPMNALGAMNEILAGLWANEPSQATELLFNASGVRVLRRNRKAAFGPAGVYLIGSRNANGVNIAKGVDGAGMDEVFLAVGEAISGLITDEKLSDDYNAYFYTNVFANSGKDVVLSDHTGLRRPSDVMERMPFGALGFARITLGMDRLMDYASEGLAKEQIRTLLFPRLEPVDQLNSVPEAEHVERAVNANRDEFILGSHLNETHPHDQVVNFLRGDDINASPWDASPGTQQDAGSLRKRQAQEFAMNCVPPAARRPDVTQSAAQWRTMLLQQATTLLPKFLAEQRALTDERAQTWTEEIQSHLVSHASSWISGVGLRVTADLLRILRDDLQQVATQEMPAEAESMRSRGADWESAVSGRLGAASALALNSKEVTQALQAIQLGAERLAEAQLLEFVPSLLKNVAKGVLEPLIEECDIAYDVLSEEINPARDNMTGRQFKEFAVLKEDRENKWVAPRYKPRQVEMLLIEPDSFPVEFEVLEKMDLLDDDKSNWASIVRTMSLQGLPLRDRDPRVKEKGSQTLIRVQVPWVPEDVRARKDSTARSQRMEIAIPKKLPEIVERNRTWLEDKESKFGQQYRMSIADYCNGGSRQDQMKRQKAFVSAFTDLVHLSAPLISMNMNAIQTFHNNPDPKLTPTGTNLRLTEIPFAEQSETGQACREILIRSGYEEKAPFEAASLTKDVFAFSTTKSAMSPMVFSSLIEPIADSWLTTSNSANAVHSFWDGRRARPLTDALPIPPEIRLSMIVGWFVSFMFGQRKKDATNPNLGIKWEVWDPSAGWVSFPYPLLPVSAVDRSPLPAILKSISLAIVEAGKLASQAPLVPYMRLKHVGREVTTHHAFSGLDLPERGVPTSTLIRDWVLNGTVPTGAPHDFELATGRSGQDPVPQTGEQRRDAIVRQARQLRDEYEQVWLSYQGKAWDELPRIYELRDDINSALAYLVQYCEGISIGASGMIEDN